MIVTVRPDPSDWHPDAGVLTVDGALDRSLYLGPDRIHPPADLQALVGAKCETCYGCGLTEPPAAFWRPQRACHDCHGTGRVLLRIETPCCDQDIEPCEFDGVAADGTVTRFIHHTCGGTGVVSTLVSVEAVMPIISLYRADVGKPEGDFVEWFGGDNGVVWKRVDGGHRSGHGSVSCRESDVGRWVVLTKAVES